MRNFYMISWFFYAQIFSLCAHKNIVVCHRLVTSRLNIYSTATFFHNRFHLCRHSRLPLLLQQCFSIRDEHYPHRTGYINAETKKKCKSVWTHFDTHNWLPVKRLLSTLPPFILFFDIYRERQLSIIHGCSGAVLGFLTMRDFCFQVFAVQLSTAAWLSYYAVQVQMVHTISLRFFSFVSLGVCCSYWR